MMSSEKLQLMTTPLRRSERILGMLYLPVHIFIFPIILNLFASVSPDSLTDIQLNLLYYAVGLGFVLIFLRKFLREGFDIFLDNPLRGILSIILSILPYYLLGMLANMLVMLLDPNLANPNNEALGSFAMENYGVMKSISLFMAPILEESLFRGVLFGHLRNKKRSLAYAASIALFALYHIWQHALASGDIRTLIYAVQYIPAGYALARCYEQSGSIWSPILMHMGINALAFSLM